MRATLTSLTVAFVLLTVIGIVVELPPISMLVSAAMAVVFGFGLVLVRAGRGGVRSYVRHVTGRARWTGSDSQ